MYIAATAVDDFSINFLYVTNQDPPFFTAP